MHECVNHLIVALGNHYEGYLQCYSSPLCPSMQLHPPPPSERSLRLGTLQAAAASSTPDQRRFSPQTSPVLPALQGHLSGDHVVLFPVPNFLSKASL
ncbi:hypothetical protein JOQ06_026049 [Pogonophryne albipinna]|uniref:Uncharacterized protein n=1 Tax=Pogonophryne albipinna TaxID=1090488 RepID=A0AAD6A668_9TELE|nr:hypothetical protein JOQ06_026049 [Pogonophryne albipinna]